MREFVLFFIDYLWLYVIVFRIVMCWSGYYKCFFWCMLLLLMICLGIG